jgi:hypothetical protein
MKMEDALDLFIEISVNCSLNKSKAGVQIGLEKLSSKKQYSLLINSMIISESSLNCIKNIIMKHGLKMGNVYMNSQEWIRIYKYRKENDQK